MLKAYFFKKLITKRAIRTTQTQILISYTCVGNFQEHWLATFDAMFRSKTVQAANKNIFAIFIHCIYVHFKA